MWKCICKCGAERNVYTNSLINGRSKSCGCLHKEKQKSIAQQLFSTHGESKTRLYRVWAGMKKRCLDKNSSNYINYGGRGISVCEDWISYDKFRDWAVSNGYENNLSIDRIDVNGNYCPENCRWVTGDAQANNRRNNVKYNIDGKEYTIADISRKYNIPYKRLHKRLSKGMDIKEAIK